MQHQGKISPQRITINEELSPGFGKSIHTFSQSKDICQDTVVARKTLTFDALRYLFQGALDRELSTILMLTAVSALGASISSKSALKALAIVGSTSMIFTPMLQQLVDRFCWDSMKISALYFTLMGIAFFCAAFVDSWILFFTFMAFAKIFDRQQIPLMIGVYVDNYPRMSRGFNVGIALTCMPIGGMLFASIASYIFAKKPGSLSGLLFLASLLALCCAICFLKIPIRKVVSKPYPPFRDSFKLIFQDRVFATILLLYSFIAIANQMTLPLRVEYLASHRHGLDISYGGIVAIFGIIQPLASVVSGPFWGKLYDRVSLITMRQCVTICFLIGIPLFFATDNLTTIYLASVLLGIGRSGGVIFWSLWISAIAPRDRVNEYMGANAAIMGLRDALSPILGYFLLEFAGPFVVGVVAFILLTFSMFGFERLCRSYAYMRRISIIGK
ncbi:MAG: MFS transporter [Puniceicoccales bacterium]|jgi:MFS family permease|nr:MFS transporter [Puniceicoccales bacterium]